MFFVSSSLISALIFILSAVFIWKNQDHEGWKEWCLLSGERWLPAQLQVGQLWDHRDEHLLSSLLWNTRGTSGGCSSMRSASGHWHQFLLHGP